MGFSYVWHDETARCAVHGPTARLTPFILSIRSSILEAAKTQRAFSLRLVNQGSAQRNNKTIPHDQRAMDRGIPNRQITSRLASRLSKTRDRNTSWPSQWTTHSPPSVDSFPSLTCRPSWSRCQGSLTTWRPSSLHLKCASENRADPRPSPIATGQCWETAHEIRFGARQNTQPAIFQCFVLRVDRGSYLRELITRLSYCDHQCYLGHCKVAVQALQKRARAS
jgi:hypothetical protein